jgi:hypothetical protein
MMSHAAAKSLFEKVAPDLTPAERLAAQAISLHESSYGAGWKEGHGAGSHNFGAIMRPPGDNGPAFQTKDSRPGKDGEQPIEFQGSFKVYPDDEAGALDVVRVALRSNVREAANKGSLDGVAAGMFKNGYYTGTHQSPTINIGLYRDALERAVSKIIAETGEENPFPKVKPAAPSPSSPSPHHSALLPLVEKGSSGDGVDLLVLLLKVLDPGSMLATTKSQVVGEQIEKIVKGFQGSHGLLIDGRVHNLETWPRLIREVTEVLERNRII